MKKECDAGIGNHLVKIGNHAWNESKFSDEDYEEAKTLLEVVKEKLMENADSIEDGEKAVANMDKKAILTELFPNINQDSSEQDTPKRMLTTQNSNEIEDFMTELEVHLNKFPYDEALKKNKELESITLNEIYKQQGVDIKNKESSVNVHTMATFLEDKGVISAQDASIAKDFYLSREELHRNLSACSEKLIAYIANVLMLMLAIFQVPSKAVGKAASSLAREAMKKVAISEAISLALGFAAGQGAGAIANFIDKVICNTLSAGQMLGAIKSALSDWWTWLTFGIELAATLAAFFLTGGWYLAVKLVAVMVGAANVIKAAIDVGNAC